MLKYHKQKMWKTDLAFLEIMDKSERTGLSATSHPEEVLNKKRRKQRLPAHRSFLVRVMSNYAFCL